MRSTGKMNTHIHYIPYIHSTLTAVYIHTPYTLRCINTISGTHKHTHTHSHMHIYQTHHTYTIHTSYMPCTHIHTIYIIYICMYVS